MKITKQQLRKIIRESIEIEMAASEGLDDLIQLAKAVDADLTIDRHEPDDESPEGLLYDLELLDLSSGDAVEYFQQYVGMPAGQAEEELRSYLERYWRQG